MPSQAILEQKKQTVKEICDRVKSAESGVLVNFYKTNVADDTAMRKELREAGVYYAVIKNSILRHAFEDAGMTELLPHLENMTALAISAEDAVAPARILAKFGEKHPDFTIKAGFIEGKIVDADEVKSIAKLPSKEVLIATFMGTINAPISGLVNVLNGNLRGLACALAAIRDQKDEEKAS